MVLEQLNLKLTVKWHLGFQCQLDLKNGTDGNLDTAINAMKAASSHRFIGINQSDRSGYCKHKVTLMVM